MEPNSCRQADKRPRRPSTNFWSGPGPAPQKPRPPKTAGRIAGLHGHHMPGRWLLRNSQAGKATAVIVLVQLGAFDKGASWIYDPAHVSALSKGVRTPRVSRHRATAPRASGVAGLLRRKRHATSSTDSHICSCFVALAAGRKASGICHPGEAAALSLRAYHTVSCADVGGRPRGVAGHATATAGKRTVPITDPWPAGG